MVPNLFLVPDLLTGSEQLDTLVPDNGVHIERIISNGQTTPEGEWYDQERDEWVALLQGNALISFEDGRDIALSPGDHLVIPAHQRHRVERTSADPPCIWLAVHANLT